MTPSLEIFNVNNSDAIITYVSTNALNAVVVPAAEQHHAGADDRVQRSDALVS